MSASLTGTSAAGAGATGVVDMALASAVGKGIAESVSEESLPLEWMLTTPSCLRRIGVAVLAAAGCWAGLAAVAAGTPDALGCVEGDAAADDWLVVAFVVEETFDGVGALAAVVADADAATVLCLLLFCRALGAAEAAPKMGLISVGRRPTPESSSSAVACESRMSVSSTSSRLFRLTR